MVALWSAPLLVLFCAWLWSAFTSGGRAPGDWLPVAIVIGLLSVVVGALVVYPRRPRQLSLVILTLFAAYSVWTAVSALWAASPGNVWPEATRTAALVLVFALALALLTDAGARRVFRYLLMAAAAAVLAGCIARLWWPVAFTSLFIDDRLVFPTGYANSSAALFVLPFWPLMWLAASPAERSPVRGIALGLATGLLTLAIMTQSRAAVLSLVATLVVVFIISPIRLRTLLYLIVPGLLLVYVFPTLNSYWVEGAETADGGGMAARAVLVATLTAAFIGMIVALLERWIPASRRMKAIFGSVVLAGALAGIIYGAVVLTQDVGGPGAWLSQAWQRVTSRQVVEPVPAGPSSSRLAAISSSGALEVWDVAWDVFAERPWLGAGAGNFGPEHDRLRTDPAIDVDDAHSLPLQTLSETGFVGGALFGLAVLLSLGALLWGRSTASWRRARRSWLRAGHGNAEGGTEARMCKARWGDDPQQYGWEMALLAALAYWLMHACLDGLWQVTAVAIPALLILAAGLAGIDARVETVWPRWNGWLRLQRRPAQARRSGPTGDTAAVAAEGLDTSPAAPGAAPDPARPPAAALRRHQGPLPAADDAFGMRRSDQYLSRWRRRRRKELRRRRSADRIRPAGTLSLAFRAALLTAGVLVVLGAVLPYVSVRLEASAVSLARTDAARAAHRAQLAGWFRPGYTGLDRLQGDLYAAAAVTAAAGASSDRAGAVADALALAAAAYEKAAGAAAAEWYGHYMAGVTTLNLLLVRAHTAEVADPAAAVGPSASPAIIPRLEDWSELPQGTGLGAAGEAAGSVWSAADPSEAAQRYRDMSTADLAAAAIGFFDAAATRNPLSSEGAAALELAQRFSAAASALPAG